MGIKSLLSQNKKIITTNKHGDTDIIYEDDEKTWEYEYLTVSGNQLNPEEADENPYRYSGESFDEETGLYYLRARYYDPELGRFLTEDPAKDGGNWYVYCYNNPILFSDPSGLGPGDEFNSADEAAIDFANYISPWSIEVNAEYGTYI